MAHPKRKHSKQRSRKRRTNTGLDFPTSVDLRLSSGSQRGVMHRVDPVTGFYKGKQIIALKPKNEKKKA